MHAQRGTKCTGSCELPLMRCDRGNGGSGVDHTSFCPNGHGMAMRPSLSKACGPSNYLYSIIVMTRCSPKDLQAPALCVPFNPL